MTHTSRAMQHLLVQLPLRERMLLDELGRVHLARTSQLARLVGTDAPSASEVRVVRRHLQRLVHSGLIRRYADRSRDRKVGAPGHLYALTAAGARATGTTPGTRARQRRSWRPSDRYLDHRLAITETYVRLVEHERAGGPLMREFLAEPSCWRRFSGPTGATLELRPDALVRLAVDGYEISWFVEVDRGDVDRPSEGPKVIAAKLTMYQRAELAGQEQRSYGVFPRVLFITPNGRRAQQIERVIARQPVSSRDLFVVAAEDQALAAMSRIEVAS